MSPASGCVPFSPWSRRLFKTTECVMLVLTRKLQQQIKIGEQITVTILKVKGNTVRVGITAPREVRVVRGELPKDIDAASAPTAPTAAIASESTASDLGEELTEAS